MPIGDGNNRKTQVVTPIDSSIEGYGEAQPVEDTPQEVKKPEPVATPGTDNTVVKEPEVKTPSFYQMWEEQNKKNDEEDEKVRKRRNRKAVMGAISDGISALSNLYFTTKGAPSSFDEQKSGMLPKMKALWDQEDERRKTQRDKYLAGKMNAMKMDEASANANRTYKLQKDIADQNQKNKERELSIKANAEERQRQLNDARIQRMAAQNNKDEALVAYYTTKQTLLESGAPLQEALTKAKTAYEKAKANKANGSGGNPKQKVVIKDGYNRYDEPQRTTTTTIEGNNLNLKGLTGQDLKLK